MKKESDFEELKTYVEQWKEIKGVKPDNEQIFYREFIKLLKNYPDDREVEFDGDGSYFGKQVTLKPFSTFGKSQWQLEFEVAYDQKQIRVYTANHHGFWNPEYISMDNKHPDFDELYLELSTFLKRVFGL